MAGFQCWGRLLPVLMSSEQSYFRPCCLILFHRSSPKRDRSISQLFCQAMKISRDNFMIPSRNLLSYPSTCLGSTFSPVLMMSSEAFPGSLFCLVLIHGSNSKRDCILSQFYIRTTIKLSLNNSKFSSRSSFVLSYYPRPILLLASFDPTILLLTEYDDSGIPEHL